jgi:hypothetical protein
LRLHQDFDERRATIHVNALGNDDAFHLARHRSVHDDDVVRVTVRG